MVYVDIWGPYNTKTYNHYRYFLTLVDDFSRVTWTLLLSCKGNTLYVLKAFFAMVKTHFYYPIRIFISNNTIELEVVIFVNNFLMFMGYSIKLPFLILLIRMELLRGNTNTSCKCLDLFYFNLMYLKIIRVTMYWLPPTLLIDYPSLFYTTFLHLRRFLMPLLPTTTWNLLDVFVLIHLLNIVEISFNLDEFQLFFGVPTWKEGLQTTRP